MTATIHISHMSIIVPPPSNDTFERILEYFLETSRHDTNSVGYEICHIDL